jgi:hypothetical protein
MINKELYRKLAQGVGLIPVIPPSIGPICFEFVGIKIWHRRHITRPTDVPDLKRGLGDVVSSSSGSNGAWWKGCTID